MSTRAHIALGSNLGDPADTLRRALEAIGRIPGVRVLATSGIYRTAPWGDAQQPHFANAAALLDTVLTPQTLLDELLALERAFGRVRDERRNGPRTLDLDLLSFGDVVLDEPGLTLPHPRIAERAFVLVPLLEIAPDLVLPRYGKLSGLLDRLVDAGAVEPWPSSSAPGKSASGIVHVAA